MPAAEEPAKKPPLPRQSTLRKADVLAAVLLVLVTLMAFWGVVRNGFIADFDDDEYVTHNPHVLDGLTRDNVIWAFTAFHSHNWHPLTWLSLQLDATSFGQGALGFHLTNLLLHVASTVLLFAALRRLTGATWRSALVAALFGGHPLHVESVAWVAERKDVLAAFFWFLTLLLYAGHARRPSLLGYLGIVLCVVLGLMAKPMFVTLPCVLLLLAFWPLRRFPGMQSASLPGEKIAIPQASLRLLIAEQLPLLALAAGCAVLTVAAQEDIVQATREFSLTSRISNALVSCVVYLGQALCPVRLGFFYPHPHDSLPAWQVVGAGLLLVAVSVVVVRQVVSRPYLLVGWLWYLGTLVPVIGLVQVGLQAHADRYTYIPLVGVFLGGVWYVAELLERRRASATIKVALASGVVLACVGLTMVQVGYWHDSRTLWQRTLEVTEGNFMAHFHLGMHCLRQHKLAAAEEHLQAASHLRPQMGKPYAALAQVRKLQRRPDEQMALLRLALERMPTLSLARIDLALLLLQRAEWQEVATLLEEGLRIEELGPAGRLYLSIAFIRLGRLDEARKFCAAALEHLGSGREWQALRGELLYQIGQIHARQGAPQEALQDYTAAVEAAPGSVRCRCALALALSGAGRPTEAQQHYDEARRIQPNWPEQARAVAAVSATHPDERFRDSLTAIELASQACAAVPGQPEYLNTLAAAYANAGRFDEACETARRALALASKDKPQLVTDLRNHLQLYKNHRPLRIVDAARPSPPSGGK
jgi:tetratricopeptide (TPR) repeat protein